MVVLQGDQVIKVARGLHGWLQAGGELPTGEAGHAGGQQIGLDLGRGSQLLGQVLVRRPAGFSLEQGHATGELSTESFHYRQ